MQEVDVSFPSPVTGGQGLGQPTNVADFCRELVETYAHRLQAQRIQLDCDVDDSLLFDVPVGIVRRVLESWIDESLNAMSEGGQLDLTVVAGCRGLEIEVADSRDVSVHEARDVWRRQGLVADGAVIDAHLAEALRVESMLCPQGGVARTLVIPDRHAAAGRKHGGFWKKVA
jgi:hypothetical protein